MLRMPSGSFRIHVETAGTLSSIRREAYEPESETCRPYPLVLQTGAARPTPDRRRQPRCPTQAHIQISVFQHPKPPPICSLVSSYAVGDVSTRRSERGCISVLETCTVVRLVYGVLAASAV